MVVSTVGFLKKFAEKRVSKDFSAKKELCFLRKIKYLTNLFLREITYGLFNFHRPSSPSRAPRCTSPTCSSTARSRTGCQGRSCGRTCEEKYCKKHCSFPPLNLVFSHFSSSFFSRSVIGDFFFLLSRFLAAEKGRKK